MHINTAVNAEQAMVNGLAMLLDYGVKRESRNGKVLMMDAPVSTVTLMPCERVIFSPERDANPFFHFSEGLWMLAGREDVEFLAGYVKRMREYSADGMSLRGAYGYRWRQYFGFDQLSEVVRALTKNPDDRRQVIQMWTPSVDLLGQSRNLDVCCNLTATVQIRGMSSVGGPALDLTVFQRSGDAMWGVHGANAVHFSMLQEYLATRIGVPVGSLTQVTVNYHLYEHHWKQAERIVDAGWDASKRYPSMLPCDKGDWYRWLTVVTSKGLPLKEREEAARGHGWLSLWLGMDRAHEAHKLGNDKEAMRILRDQPVVDWVVAATAWLDRRMK